MKVSQSLLSLTKVRKTDFVTCIERFLTTLPGSGGAHLLNFPSIQQCAKRFLLTNPVRA
jgi:hypothetical protein